MSKFSCLVILVSLCISLQSCTVVSVKRVKVVEHKKPNKPRHVFDRNIKEYRLRHVSSNDKSSTFDIFLANTKIQYEEQSFAVKGVEEKSLERDKKGRMKSYFIGPAWVVPASGADEYLLNLGLSTVMSLGVALLIAIGDWASLPVRVIDSDFEENRRDVKKLATETSEAKVSETLTVILYKKTYTAKNGQIAIPNSEFKKVYGSYRIATLPIQVRHKGKTWRHYQQIKSIFSKETFERLKSTK